MLLSGIQEVVITGIHIASYGIDFEENISLIDLLQEIDKIDGIQRIRLGSLEPKIITEEFVDKLKELKKICNHFHLSLQSGCDETLKRMNRKYNTQEFRKSVKLLRDAFPDVALTTDIIVGFPGETEQEFNSTYKFLKEIDFAKMHVFKYSKRKGTVAAKMETQIPEEVKEERSRKVIDLSNKNEVVFMKQFIGKKMEVLFEEEKNGFFKGHTTNYIMVKTKNKKNKNSIEKVLLTEINGLEILGKSM